MFPSAGAHGTGHVNGIRAYKGQHCHAECPPSAVSGRGRLLALCLSQISRCLLPVSKMIWLLAIAILMRVWTAFARFMETAVRLDVLGLRRAIGGESGIEGLLGESESDFSRNLAESTAADECADSPGRVGSAHATAGESEEVIGSSRLSESEFPSLNSSRLGSLSSACARRVARCIAAAPARVCLGCSSPGVSAAVAHVHASTLHDACPNSFSDTGRVEGPTGSSCTKGGVSGPAEDLRPVSEVEAGVNFRPAGTGAGCRFNSQ